MTNIPSTPNSFIKWWLDSLPEIESELDPHDRPPLPPSKAPLNRGMGKKLADAMSDYSVFSERPVKSPDDASSRNSASTRVTLKGRDGYSMLEDDFGLLTRYGSKLPNLVGTLTPALKRLKNIQKNQAIFPSAVKAELEALLEETFYFHESFFYEPDGNNEKEILKQLQDIQEAAQQFGYRDEDSWINNVHQPLFQLALAGRDSASVSYHAVKNTPLHNKFALQGARRIINKKIDAVITMETTPNEELLLRPIFTSTEYHNVNIANNVQPIRLKPISIYIEFKDGSGQDEDKESLFQLCVWAIAQMKLWKLFRVVSQNLFLPLISIRGPVWLLSIFECRLDEKGIDQEKILHGEFHVGDVRKLPDVYRILQTLRELYRWTDVDFRKWFYTSILSFQPPPTPPATEASIVASPQDAPMPSSPDALLTPAQSPPVGPIQTAYHYPTPPPTVGSVGSAGSANSTLAHPESPPSRATRNAPSSDGGSFNADKNSLKPLSEHPEDYEMEDAGAG